MKIFLAQLDPALTEQDLRAYLEKYGELEDVRLVTRRNYGFAFFKDPFNPDELLSNMSHSIDGRTFIVQKGHEQSDRDSLRPRQNSRRCEYCDRCPIHGSGSRDSYDRPVRMVVENLAPNTTNKDIGTFVRARGFDPCYVRVRGDYAFVDFRTEAERADALRTLNGQTMQVRGFEGDAENSCVVSIRPFVSSEQMRRDGPMKKPCTATTFPSNCDTQDDTRVADMYKDSDEAHGKAEQDCFEGEDNNGNQE